MLQTNITHKKNEIFIVNIYRNKYKFNEENNIYMFIFI